MNLLNGMIFVFAYILLHNVNAHPISWKFKYHSRLDVDSDKVQLWWDFDETHIWLKLKVFTLGYVAFGFSNNEEFRNSDMILAWVAPNKTVFFKDGYALSDGLITVDDSQDYEYYGREEGNFTILQFKRKLDTCDEMDLKLTGDSMFLHWAYHQSDPKSWSNFSVLGTVKGTTPILLFNHRAMHLIAVAEAVPTEAIILEAKVAKIESAYVCSVLKLPNFSKKRHVIKRNLIMPSELRSSVKHVVLHACSNSIDMSRFYHEIYPCYQEKFPEEWFYCNNIVTGWVVGSDEEFYWPKEAGFSLGTSDDPKYVMLEIQFDQMPPTNDVRKKKKELSIGLELLYTSQIREHDSGVISIGPEPSDWFFLPPRQENFVVEGHCIGKCTAWDFPSSGVTLYASQFYTHGNVKMAQSIQVQSGKEVAYVARDDNIMTNYQHTRYLNEPLVVKPGDSLITRCYYDTSKESNVLTSGVFWYQKPCMQLIFYYPKIPRLTSCRSEVLPSQIYPIFADDHDKKNADFNYQSIFDTEIKVSKNETMTFYDHLNTLDWSKNDDRLQRLKNIYKGGDFLNLCRDVNRSPLHGTETYNTPPTIYQWLPNQQAPTCDTKRVTSGRTTHRSYTKMPTKHTFVKPSRKPVDITHKSRGNNISKSLYQSEGLATSANVTKPTLSFAVSTLKIVHNINETALMFKENFKTTHQPRNTVQLTSSKRRPYNVSDVEKLIFVINQNNDQKVITQANNDKPVEKTESAVGIDLIVKGSLEANTGDTIYRKDEVDDIFEVQVIKESREDLIGVGNRVTDEATLNMIADDIPNFISLNTAYRLKPENAQINSALSHNLSPSKIVSLIALLTTLSLILNLL